jgi:hypothetical protein
LNILIIFGEAPRCAVFPVSYYFIRLGSKYSQHPFLKALSLWSSVNVKHQVSHPYKATALFYWVEKKEVASYCFVMASGLRAFLVCSLQTDSIWLPCFCTGLYFQIRPLWRAAISKLPHTPQEVSL